MCMADYRISRFVTTTYKEIPATASDQQLAAPSKQRVGILIYYNIGTNVIPTTTSNACVAVGQTAVVNKGIPIDWLSDGLEYTFDRNGNLPQLEFRGIDQNASPGSFVVIEHCLPESILNAYLEKL